MKLKQNLTKKELQRAMKIAIKEINEWSRFKAQVHKALWKINQIKR